MDRHTRRTCLSGLALAAGVGVTAAGLVAPVTARTYSRARPPVVSRQQFDRYARLFTAFDPAFLDFYADDVRLVVGDKDIVGKAGIWAHFARLRENFTETMEPIWFCSDAHGVAAELRGAYRCIRDVEDSPIFHRSVRAGEVRRIQGIVLYDVRQGRFTRLRGAKPAVVQDWTPEG